MNAVVLSVLLFTIGQGAAAGPSAADRQAAATYLEETKQQFLKSIDGLSEAQWTFKAGPDRWSIAEVAEHIAISESTILGLITDKILQGPVATTKAPLPDEKVMAMITDRSQKAQAPEMLRPANRWATRQALTIGRGGPGGRSHSPDEWTEVEQGGVAQAVEVALAIIVAAAALD